MDASDNPDLHHALPPRVVARLVNAEVANGLDRDSAAFISLCLTHGHHTMPKITASLTAALGFGLATVPLLRRRPWMTLNRAVFTGASCGVLGYAFGSNARRHAENKYTFLYRTKPEFKEAVINIRQRAKAASGATDLVPADPMEGSSRDPFDDPPALPNSPDGSDVQVPPYTPDLPYQVPDDMTSTSPSHRAPIAQDRGSGDSDDPNPETTTGKSTWDQIRAKNSPSGSGESAWEIIRRKK